MTSPLDIVQNFYTAFGDGNLEKAFTFLSNDVIWTLEGPEDIPYFGIYHGQSGVQKFFSILFDVEIIHEFVPIQYIADNNTVAVVGHEKCESKKTGKKFSASWVHIIEVKDNLITSWREVINTNPIVEAYQ